MKDRAVTLVVSVLALLSFSLLFVRACDYEYAERDRMNGVMLNPSSDGRYHTCGFVTEDGVTEYLDTYVERCGDVTLAGEVDNG